MLEDDVVVLEIESFCFLNSGAIVQDMPGKSRVQRQELVWVEAPVELDAVDFAAVDIHQVVGSDFWDIECRRQCDDPHIRRTSTGMDPSRLCCSSFSRPGVGRNLLGGFVRRRRTQVVCDSSFLNGRNYGNWCIGLCLRGG